MRKYVHPLTFFETTSITKIPTVGWGDLAQQLMSVFEPQLLSLRDKNASDVYNHLFLKDLCLLLSCLRRNMTEG